MSRKVPGPRFVSLGLSALVTVVVLVVGASVASATGVPNYGHWVGTISEERHFEQNGKEGGTDKVAHTFTTSGSPVPGEPLVQESFDGPGSLQWWMQGNYAEEADTFYPSGEECKVEVHDSPKIAIPEGNNGFFVDAFSLVGSAEPGRYAIVTRQLVEYVTTVTHSGPAGCDHSSHETREVSDEGSAAGNGAQGLQEEFVGQEPEHLHGTLVSSCKDVSPDTCGGGPAYTITQAWDMHLVGVADTDGDGVDDYVEFINGTDPLNPASVPPPGSPGVPAGPGGGGNPGGGEPGEGIQGGNPGGGGNGGGPPPPPPPPGKSPVFVAMGDSYSSGEGAEAYDPATNVLGHDECHRSSLAWSQIAGKLAAMPHVFLACSGATTSKLLYGGTGSGAWNEHQLVTLGSYRASPTQYVKDIALTIGGNDVNFSDTIKTCVSAKLSHKLLTHGEECRQFVPYPNLAALLTVLKNTYAKIHGAAPSAEIYVLGYPRLFAREPHADRCDVYPKDAVWANRLTEHVDSVIARAAREAGPYMHFVDTWNAFNNHELCRHGTANKSYMHGAKFKASSIKHKCLPWLVLPLAPPVPCVIYLEPDAHVESFHPNVQGYQAMAKAFEAALP